MISSDSAENRAATVFALYEIDLVLERAAGGKVGQRLLR
jgi:hypothetical protein